MRVQPLRRGQIRRCVEIERVLFAGDGPWGAWAFRAELDAGGYYLAAIADDGVLAGYAGLAFMGSPGDWETSVHTIGVDPAYQGHGIGSALLRGLLDKADELGAAVVLEVRTDNAPALVLYERHGFERLGTRAGYYEVSGADAYTMRRPAQPVTTTTDGRSAR